jgi:predicted transposase YbfD/YdcC
MGKALSYSIEAHFHTLPDPRKRTQNMRHNFLDILVIAICAVLCGANDWVAVATFGRAKERWFRRFLELPNGIPSHDTFTDVFTKLDPDRFQHCFVSWMSRIATLLPGDIVNVDGKTLRRSYDRQDGRAAIHMVSAWARRNALVLGQVKTDEKSNEITAIPQLLNVLEVTGCLVTIDAMGCQKAIATTIREKGADYLLALKENHPTLHQAVDAHFHPAQVATYATYDVDFAETRDHGHGRDEIRRCWVEHDVEWLAARDEWTDLNAVVMVQTERRCQGKLSQETRYYLTSGAQDASEILDVTREHWSIENGLHWRLDVAFREDECRIRKGHGAENFAILRHFALNLLNQEQTTTVGMQNKRLKAGWDECYLETVLRGFSGEIT